jgi:hypothetical protein
MARSRWTPAMLIGRCSSKFSSHKLQAESITSQAPIGAYPDFLPRSIGQGGVCVLPQRRAHEARQRHRVPHEIRRTEVEGPAVLCTAFTNFKANSCSPQPHAPAPAPAGRPPGIDGKPIAPTGKSAPNQENRARQLRPGDRSNH